MDDMDRRFGSVGDTVDLIGSVLTSNTRFWSGMQAKPAAVRPERRLELYEFEGCPFCRLVREVVTELDLEVLIYPCPKGGERFRPKVKELGGKLQFPFLMDPNTDTRLYESADITEYLFETYGKRAVPMRWRLRAVNVASSVAAGASRLGAGTRARPSRPAEQPLELYSFEASPFARRVRELLCELELPYVLHSVGRLGPSDYVPPVLRDRLPFDLPVHGASRQAFRDRVGRISVPYLVDPNTGTELAESGDIRDYLRATYAPTP